VSEPVRIGDATLYLGDCLDILPTLGPVDAVVTDPPWGIGIGSGTTSRERGKALYASDAFDDSETYVMDVCIPAFSASLKLSSGRAMVTPGVRCLWLYPRPRAVGGFYQPAAVGMSPWGFAGYNPVLFYGKDPRDGKGQSSVMTTLTERPSDDRHPCAKPIGAMVWMVGKASLAGETILDPFMGSGTTGVACARLGRKFIGIEIEPRYFDIACKRISREYEQLKLFPPEKKREAVQMELGDA
jgi:DNA modification methylase